MRSRVLGAAYTTSYPRFTIQNASIPMNLRQMTYRANYVTDWHTILSDALLAAADLGRELYLDGGTYPILTASPINIPAGTKLIMHPEAQLQRGWGGISGGFPYYLLRTVDYDWADDEAGTDDIVIVGGQITNLSSAYRGGALCLIGENITVDGLHVDGWMGSFGITCAGRNHYYNNIHMTNPTANGGSYFGVDGIHICGGDGFRITNSYIHSGDDGVGIFPLSNGVNLNLNTSDIAISGCTLNSEYGRLVGIGLFTSGLTCTIQRIVVRDCVGSSKTPTAQMLNIRNTPDNSSLINDITFENVHAEYLGASEINAVRIELAKRISLLGCRLSGITGYGVIVECTTTGSEDIRILDNTFEFTGSGTRNGITFTTGTHKNVHIANNHLILRSTQHGINIAPSANANDWHVEHNKVEGIGNGKSGIFINNTASPIILHNELRRADGATTAKGISLDVDTTDALLLFNDVRAVDTAIADSGARTIVINRDTGSGTLTFTIAGIIINGSQILSSRKTGWTAATGNATRTSYATSTVTVEQLAERLKALLDDLISHGLIGT